MAGGSVPGAKRPPKKSSPKADSGLSVDLNVQQKSGEGKVTAAAKTAKPCQLMLPSSGQAKRRNITAGCGRSGITELSHWMTARGKMPKTGAKAEYTVYRKQKMTNDT